MILSCNCWNFTYSEKGDIQEKNGKMYYKYKNTWQTYDVKCFLEGDDNRSLIMKNVQNMQNMQNMQKSKISQSSINSQTCLGHLVLLFEDWKCYFFNMVTCLVIKGSP